MRIAVVGSGRSVHVLARSAALAARGHDVRVVTLGPVLEVDGVDVRTRPIPSTPWAAIVAARSFLTDIWSFHADILHLHYAGGKLATMATASGVHPMVVTVMGGDVLPEQHATGVTELERRATRRVLEEADLILLKSHGLRNAVSAFGDFTGKTQVVRWGVDPERFREDPASAEALRERLAIPPEARVIVSPRSVRPLYNTHLLIEAMRSVREHLPQAVLLLTEHGADPAYRDTLSGQIELLGLADCVRFIGRIPHREMPALYSLADVVVSVPSSDGLPQSLFEAMACGAPVVLGRLPGYEEVVRDGETAVLTDLTSEAIAQSVRRLLTNAELCRSIAERAQNRVREIALLPQELARVESFYTDLTAQRRRRAGPLLMLDILSLVIR